MSYFMQIFQITEWFAATGTNSNMPKGESREATCFSCYTPVISFSKSSSSFLGVSVAKKKLYYLPDYGMKVNFAGLSRLVF